MSLLRRDRGHEFVSSSSRSSVLVRSMSLVVRCSVPGPLVVVVVGMAIEVLSTQDFALEFVPAMDMRSRILMSMTSTLFR